MTVELEPLVSIPTLALKAHRSRSSMFRLVLRMYADDVASGGCDWLVRGGPGCKLRVNLSRLEKAHPALFHVKYVSRADHESLVDRVSECEDALREHNKRINAVGARVTALQKPAAHT